MAIDLQATKKIHRVWLITVSVIIVVLLIFFFRQELQTSILELGSSRPISRSLNCDTDRFDEVLLKSRYRSDEAIRLLVSFTQKPTPDARDYLRDNGVVIHLRTWIFDYLVAETTIEHLCFLAELPGITYISLGE